MVCEHCGMVVDDSAVFCNQCGKRVDGKKACPICGKTNEKDFAYCQYCGARIDGKNVCAACGTAHDGEFCPTCGKEKAAEEVAVTATAIKTERKPFVLTEKHKSLLDMIGGIGMMIGVFFSLLFVFFIGVEINMASAAEELGEAERDIFYYIFDYFGDMKNVKVTDAKVNGFLKTSMTVYGVMALVVSVATLATVIAFASRAITIYVKGWLGKTDEKADKWAFFTMLSFYMGVGAFLVLNKNEMSVMGMTVEMELSGAASAGMVFSALGLATYLLCRWAKKGKALLEKQTLIKLGFIGGAVLILSIVCTQARNVGAYVSMAQSGMTISGAQAYLPFSISFIQTGNLTNGTVVWDKTVEMTVYSMIAQGISLALVVASVRALFLQIKNLICDEQSVGIKQSVGCVVLSVALLVVECLMMTALKDVYALSGAQSTTPMDVDYGHMIWTLVVSALALAFAIFTNVYYKKAQAKAVEESQNAQSNQAE